jgi:glycosyltransferase involved in cell wall biosynthesis
VISIVVPSVGRPSLATLLEVLAGQRPPVPIEVIVVDDRRDRSATLVDIPAVLKPHTRVVGGAGAGPAAARNVGWRAAGYPWISFLDDDVVPAADWLARLAEDVGVDDTVAGVQGRIEVPLPAHRRPTDWERVTDGLTRGRWITADMAYRRTVLATVGGFDERFSRAFREDADLAARVRAVGGRLVMGGRRVTHPVRPESVWVSVRTQAGNADDVLLRRRYGPRWRQRLGIPPGRRRRHLVVAAAGVLALGGALRRSPGRSARLARLAGALVWLAGTAEFAAARIKPGPCTPHEVAVMLITSVAIPPLAIGHWLLGWWRYRHAPQMPPK